VVYRVFQLQPFEGSRDADVAYGENEFDTPGPHDKLFLLNIKAKQSSGPAKPIPYRTKDMDSIAFTFWHVVG